MKITSKFLHLPPHISTSWMQVRAIFLKQNDLVVSLIDGTMIVIHGLQPDLIETIFNAHATFLENHFTRPNPPPLQLFQIASQGNPANPHQEHGEKQHSMRINFDNLESMTSAMQHNPAQANMPNLPKEVVNKIAEIARVVAPDEINNMPKPEPHCNCTHCQIARAIHEVGQPAETSPTIAEHPQTATEEVISEADLVFQQWEITKTGDQLYSVANRLDQLEKYTVFLGEPVGCTCGKSGCEHILAVLKS